MQITSSYAVRIVGPRSFIDPTVQIYRDAIAYMIDIANKEWDDIGPVYHKSANRGQRALEKLIHGTEKNTAKYDFDVKFKKFPSYFRRAAQKSAVGAVSSYRSNLKNWEENGKVGNEPKLTYERNAMPVFFRDNMSKSDKMLAGQEDVVELKLYINDCSSDSVTADWPYLVGNYRPSGWEKHHP